jgi:hypothetical protein
MVPRLLILATILAATASSASALVIDSFEAGPLQLGPESTNLALEQNGLPPASAIGGSRDWFAHYGGSLAVDTTSGSLQLNHDRGPFEVAILRYGHVLNTSPAAPLNADFTAEGHTQITFRLERTVSSAPIGNKLPAYLQLSLRSGVGSANEVGASFAVRPFISDEAMVVQMPFSEFQGFAGPLDFTDIDGIDLSFHFEDFAELEISEIATSAGLPGDYNLDGTVNAADYVVWRDRVGMTSLPNRDPAASGIIGTDDFHFWKAQFGQTFPPAATAGLPAATVPEPAMCLLLTTIAACGLASLRPRTISRPRTLLAV